MKSGRFIGVMSGTSLDGVDVVLATIDEHRVAQLASLSWPIPVSLKQAVLDICQGQQLTLSQFGQLDTQLGRLFADAVNALLKEQNLQARDIVAIGCHGQTVWHEPTGVAPHTLQIGDNNQIVARTGITVVGDFRRRDIALGGQGAPLVPAFHHALLAHPTERRMVLNIGGILESKFLELKQKFQQGEVPLPSFWGGFRVSLEQIEFWQGGEHRLHDRFLYQRENDAWKIDRLAP